MSLTIQGASKALPSDPTLQAWRDSIRETAARGGRLVIAGGGSKAFYGRPVDGERLDVTPYRGIVGYEPSELVITARCGTPLLDIETALAERGQMLACEPPRFSPATTLGGAVASGLSGPRRMAAGALRDFVLGVRLLNGEGELLSFGGQVMKNVAGYDVSRLLCGSLGCLGVLAEVSLKVLPLPRRERSLRLSMGEAEALTALNLWVGRALPVSASVWHDGVLTLRLSGAEPAVNAARLAIGGEELAAKNAEDWWRSLREQRYAFFAPDETALFRLSLPETAPPLAINAPQLIEWNGAERWLRASLNDLQKFRQVAALHGGHASVFRAPEGETADDVFAPVAPPLWRIHREIKAAFDPAGVFNRGRLYQEL